MVKARGSKRQVWEGFALRTSGGLTKSDLMKNKRGRIVSKRQHAAGLRALKNIQKYTLSKEGMRELRNRRRKKKSNLSTKMGGSFLSDIGDAVTSTAKSVANTTADVAKSTTKHVGEKEFWKGFAKGASKQIKPTIGALDTLSKNPTPIGFAKANAQILNAARKNVGSDIKKYKKHKSHVHKREQLEKAFHKLGATARAIYYNKPTLFKAYYPQYAHLVGGSLGYLDTL